MTLSITVLPEPALEFRYNQLVEDPHAGLALFGPFDTDFSGRPTGITYGVVGTPEGIELFGAFSSKICKPIISQPYGDPDENKKPQLLWPPFPGFEAVFGAMWPDKPAWIYSLDRKALTAAARHNDRHRRAYDVSNLYLDAIKDASERDEAFNLILCVIPDEVYENCRPKSRVVRGIGEFVTSRERIFRRDQPHLFGEYDSKAYEMSVDFRRQLKGRAMEHNIPLQLVRESTLLLREYQKGDARGLTPLSDRAWNLSTTIYYKSGGKPWRLSTAREGVCYVGLAFRRSEIDANPQTACCAAQMFLDTGDGVVFRGEFGPWYSQEEKEFHLTDVAAENLLIGVLETYKAQGGRELKEIFLHSRSWIDDKEFSGYKRACPVGVNLVGIRVRRDNDGLRLYRPGKWPVLRGSLWVLNDRTAYLWTTGFKPSVLSYDGWEVPVPLRIDIHHGNADIRQVASDILGLTKLNYNACRIGDSYPVTVGFSDAVGEILIGNPTVKVRKPAFKFWLFVETSG